MAVQSPSIFSNLATMNYSLRKNLNRTISKSRMPESLKFFLFGVSKRRRRSRKDSSEIIEEFPVIESGNHSLAESIEKWASIESNILRDFSMQSIAIGLGLDVS